MSTHDDEYRPLPGDEHLPAPLAAVGSIGTEHLKVHGEVLTFAAEAWKNDGTDHQPVIIIEVQGSYNRTHEDGTAKLILSDEAAVVLFETLGHSLRVLLAAQRGGGAT